MRTIKIKLAVLGTVVACIAGVWAPTASASTPVAPAASCAAGVTGYWSGYWTWTGQTWRWTWVWHSCTGGWVS